MPRRRPQARTLLLLPPPTPRHPPRLPLHHRRPPRPRAPRAIFDLGPLEDSVAIQIAISKVVNAIATNQIDLNHGRAILYGLHLASTNARRLNSTPEPTRVVRGTHPDPTALTDETAATIAPEGATTDIPDHESAPEPQAAPTQLPRPEGLTLCATSRNWRPHRKRSKPSCRSRRAVHL